MTNIFKEALISQSAALMETQGERFTLVRNGERIDTIGIFSKARFSDDDIKNGLRQSKEKFFLISSIRAQKGDIIERGNESFFVIALPNGGDFSKSLDSYSILFRTGLLKQ